MSTTTERNPRGYGLAPFGEGPYGGVGAYAPWDDDVDPTPDPTLEPEPEPDPIEEPLPDDELLRALLDQYRAILRELLRQMDDLDSRIDDSDSDGNGR